MFGLRHFRGWLGRDIPRVGAGGDLLDRRHRQHQVLVVDRGLRIPQQDAVHHGLVEELACLGRLAEQHGSPSRESERHRRGYTDSGSARA